MQSNIRPSNAPVVLRLVHTEDVVLPQDNTGAFSDALPIDKADPRWIAAVWLQARVQMHLANHPIRKVESLHAEMVDWCTRMGFHPLHCEALILIVQRAQTRGGLDRTAMDEILRLPIPVRNLNRNQRMIVFSVMGLWSVLIAGMMVVVSQMM